MCSVLLCVTILPSGCPLPISVVETTSAFLGIHFVDHWPPSAGECQTLTAREIHLLLVCNSGAIHTVATRQGTKASAAQLTERCGRVPCTYTETSFNSNTHLSVHFILFHAPPQARRQRRPAEHRCASAVPAGPGGLGEQIRIKGYLESLSV